MENFDLRKNGLIRLMIFFLIETISAGSSIAQPSLFLNPVVTTNLVAPIQVVNAGDGSGRLFVAEKGGMIKVFGSSPLAGPYPYQGTFLDLSTIVGTTGEGGLLSIVFHPDYEKAGDPNQGDLFVYYTDRLTQPNSDLILAKYKVSDPAANSATVVSVTEILRIPHPGESNHNGGEMHFDKSGLLYLSVGDGGGGGDPSNNAQKKEPLFTGDKSYLLGKMLRLDVDNISGGTNYSIPAQNPFGNEIFSYGLRNPFRWSFDRTTGDMWIGDVGQDNWEEIDFSAASANGGVNYGWNCFEGNTPYNNSTTCNALTNYTPAYVYDGQSVVGGTVYRGSRYIDLKGYYVGADYYTGNLHLIRRNDANNGWTTTVQPGTVLNIPNLNISDIGESESGELYAVSLASNSIYHIQASGALPVKLVNFDGKKTLEGNRLSWQTSFENNSSEFEIEHSVDSRHFIKVGNVSSQNAAQGSRYQFTHSAISSVNNYYRLKMIDTDHSFEHSRIISVNEDKVVTGDFVRPSLINSGTMDLLLENDYQSLELVHANGSVFYKQNISGKTGNFRIPVSTASSGLYIVRLTGNDHVKQQKVMILH